MLDKGYDVNSGSEVAITNKSTPEELVAFISAALPEFDRSRVHNSDIKKLAQWYNILVKAGMTEFTEKEEEQVEQSAAAEKPVVAKKTTAAKKPATSAVKGKGGAVNTKSKVTTTKSTTARKAQ